MFFSRNLPARRMTSATPPTTTDVEFVSFRCLKKNSVFSQKLPCAPRKPNSFGNCVLARKNATPPLKPIITLSEMKCTSTPAFASQAMKAMTATRKAVPIAKLVKRHASPPAISASDTPRTKEIAEVTVIEVKREPQKIQKTRPLNRHA